MCVCPQRWCWWDCCSWLCWSSSRPGLPDWTASGSSGRQHTGSGIQMRWFLFVKNTRSPIFNTWLEIKSVCLRIFENPYLSQVAHGLTSCTDSVCARVEVEDVHRRAVWEENRSFITKHNLEAAMGLHSYNLGMNYMGDLVRRSLWGRSHHKQLIIDRYWFTIIDGPVGQDHREAGPPQPPKSDRLLFGIRQRRLWRGLHPHGLPVRGRQSGHQHSGQVPLHVTVWGFVCLVSTSFCVFITTGPRLMFHVFTHRVLFPVLFCSLGSCVSCLVLLPVCDCLHQPTCVQLPLPSLCVYISLCAPLCPCRIVCLF